MTEQDLDNPWAKEQVSLKVSLAKQCQSGWWKQAHLESTSGNKTVLPWLQLWPGLPLLSDWLVVDWIWFWPASVQAGENTCTSPWSTGSWCSPCKQWLCYQCCQSSGCHWGEQSGNLSPLAHSFPAETHDTPEIGAVMKTVTTVELLSHSHDSITISQWIYFSLWIPLICLDAVASVMEKKRTKKRRRSTELWQPDCQEQEVGG